MTDNADLLHPRSTATDIVDQIDEAVEMIDELLRRTQLTATYHPVVSEAIERLACAKRYARQAHFELTPEANRPAPAASLAPISIRNRNPGNLRPTAPGVSRWRGEEDTDNAYAKFSSDMWGTRAMLYLLRISYRGRGLNTVGKIIDRYSPHHDNAADSVLNYKKKLAYDLGVSITDPIDVTDTKILFSLARSIAQFESGREITALSGSQGDQLLAEAYRNLPIRRRRPAA